MAVRPIHQSAPSSLRDRRFFSVFFSFFILLFSFFFLEFFPLNGSARSAKARINVCFNLNWMVDAAAAAAAHCVCAAATAGGSKQRGKKNERTFYIRSE